MKKLMCMCLAMGLLFGASGCKDKSAIDATDVTEGIVTKCFIGTVVEEDGTFMYVEPDEGEEERELSDCIGVFYTRVHADYFYGTGRRVVVYYQSDAINEKGEIVTDDISTEGFRDFEMVVKDNGSKSFDRVLDADEGGVKVSSYGVDVTINVDGKSITLKEALEKGFITPQAIVVRANRDVMLNQAKLVEYRDGGSREYVYDAFKIIKYYKADGKRDLYIGNLNLKYT